MNILLVTTCLRGQSKSTSVQLWWVLAREMAPSGYLDSIDLSAIIGLLESKMEDAVVAY